MTSRDERPAPSWVGDVSAGVDAWTPRAPTPDRGEPLDERQLGQGKENARTFLKDNPDLANELEKKILEKLGVGPQVDAEVVAEPIGVDDF